MNHYRVFTAIKRSFSQSQTYKEALELALSKETGPKGGRRYICAECGRVFTRKEIQVDHIDPVVPIGVSSSTMSFCEVYRRTYCSTDNLQVLCKECHSTKSKEENSKRREFNKRDEINFVFRSSINPCEITKRKG